MGGVRDRTDDRSVTARAFGVLEAFTPAAPTLTLSEIARRAGLPLTTPHRLVAELRAAGALERDGDGTYRIGLRLWEIASLAPRGVPLREAALPFLEDLYEVTHENAQLGVREGHDVVYIERIAGRRAVGVLTRVGGRFPLHASGIGLVLLAHAPERRAARGARRPPPAVHRLHGHRSGSAGADPGPDPPRRRGDLTTGR